jgi:Ni/Fe-hydrogenase subunit HybB-like protein
MFLLENVLLIGALLILVYPINRRSPRMVFIAAMLIMAGGGLYRLNAYLVGYDSGIGYHYFPSAPELIITFSIIAVEIMGYTWFVKRFPVLPKVEHA